MINNLHQLTPAKRIRKPSYSTLAQWVGEAWNEISPRLIRNAFKCCGISVNMDGSEDDMVFDYRILDEDLANTNDENIEEAADHDDVDGEEYEEETGDDNDWE